MERNVHASGKVSEISKYQVVAAQEATFHCFRARV